MQAELFVDIFLWPGGYRLIYAISLALAACGTAQAQSSANANGIIAQFGGDLGASPQGVVADSRGRLYGGAYYDGAYGCGTIFELTPPTSGASSWSQTVLHQFDNSDGCSPTGPLTIGSDGSLYGVTAGGTGGGKAFRLTPAGNGFTFEVLQNLGGIPVYGMVFGPGGLLYGVTYDGNGNGFAYSLNPSGGAAGFAIIYNFGANNQLPYSPLTISGDTIYGQTFAGGGNGAGSDYMLHLANGVWTEQVIYDFNSYPGDLQYPAGSALLLAKSGTLYSCTGTGGAYGHGGVFSLSPPKIAGQPWTETILYSFGAQTGDPSGEYCFMTGTPEGKLLGTSDGGGANGRGTVFKMIRPAIPGAAWREEVLFSFEGNPANAPLSLSGNQAFGSTALSGAGPGYVYEGTLR